MSVVHSVLFRYNGSSVSLEGHEETFQENKHLNSCAHRCSFQACFASGNSLVLLCVQFCESPQTQYCWVNVSMLLCGKCSSSFCVFLQFSVLDFCSKLSLRDGDSSSFLGGEICGIPDIYTYIHRHTQSRFILWSNFTVVLLTSARLDILRVSLFWSLLSLDRNIKCKLHKSVIIWYRYSMWQNKIIMQKCSASDMPWAKNLVLQMCLLWISHWHGLIFCLFFLMKLTIVIQKKWSFPSVVSHIAISAKLNDH